MKASSVASWLGWRNLNLPLGRALPIRIRPRRFRLAFTFYQRETTYSLALAALSAYAKQEVPDLEVSLVAVSRGDAVDDYVRRIASLKPHLIAVSSMHPTWLPFLPYLNALEARFPHTPVIVGGYQAIFSPEETLAHSAIDYVCVGDGEESLIQLIRRLQKHNGKAEREEHGGVIPGLWEKRASGKVLKSGPVLTENLAEMPFPDYSIFEREGDLRWLSPHAIESKNLTTLPVMSGRGCPYRCSYCSNTSLLELYQGKGTILRKYDPGKFIGELIRLRDRYGIQYFQFMDETFSFDRKYTYHLLGLYGQEIHLPFSCFVRVEQLDEEFCRAAAAAGCHSMWFGVESGSEEYRRRYLARRMPNRRIIDAAENARRFGIKRMIFNMVGMPFETRENILETLELTRKIRPELAVFGQFLPLPGTPLYKLAEHAGLLLAPSEHQQMWTIGTLNIQEQPGGITEDEFKELIDQIMQYLWENNVYDK